MFMGGGRMDKELHYGSDYKFILATSVGSRVGTEFCQTCIAILCKLSILFSLAGIKTILC